MRQTIFLLFFFIIKSLNAQYSLGVFTGYTNNHLQTNISNRTFTENKNGNSFGAGIILNYQCSNKIHLQTEMNLLHKNYSFVRTGNYEGIFTNYRNAYLQLPVIIQYKFIQKHKWQFFAETGFFVSYWVDGRINGVIPNVFDSYYTVDGAGVITNYLRFTSYYQKYQFTHLKDNRFEWGALAGITSMYQLTNKYSFFANARFYQSFLSQQKKYSVNQVMQYNQTFVISLGCMLHLHAKI